MIHQVMIKARIKKNLRRSVKYKYNNNNKITNL